MPSFGTSYESHGYDGKRGNLKWWFEAWGSGPKADWLRRSEVGRPPRPSELRSADYIVVGIRSPNGRVRFRTHTGGLDLDPRISRRKTKKVGPFSEGKYRFIFGDDK